MSARNFPLNLVPSTLVTKVFLEIFLRERRSEPRSGDNESRGGEEREKKTFFSLSSLLRGSLSLSRRKISRKASGTRVRSQALHLRGDERKNGVIFPLWSRKKKFSRPYNQSFINQVCSVKMAGYCSLFSSSSLSIKTKKRAWPIGSLNDARQPEMTPFPFKFALTLPNLYC